MFVFKHSSDYGEKNIRTFSFLNDFPFAGEVGENPEEVVAVLREYLRLPSGVM